MGQRRRWFRPILVLCTALGTAAAVYLAVDRLTREDPYSSIEDRLYVGESTDRPPPGTGAVVNLCARPGSYAVDACLWVPIDGSEAAHPEWLRRLVAFIDGRRRAGVTTYVHCLAGMNRSGKVVPALLDVRAPLDARASAGVRAVEATAGPAEPGFDAVAGRVGGSAERSG